jgi:predicted tellurium resistance membrane protein TerC
VITLLSDPSAWLAFAVLSALEIVLGIDNIIFISILVGRLPPRQRPQARVAGLGLAMLTRIGLLFCIVWLTRLTRPWLMLVGHEYSGRDLILFAGGLFLLVKSGLEIRGVLAGAADSRHVRAYAAFAAIVLQIAVIDIVFSLDSVFTAVGLARPDQVLIMVASIIVAVGVMMWVSGPISAFVERQPTVKILALAFLVLVGLALMGEGADLHVPKGYLYYAMAFAVAVEMINLRLRALLARRHGPTHAVQGRPVPHGRTHDGG